MIKNTKIAVIGLGYVGLPLSIAFSKHFETIGYDINQQRVNQLKKYNNVTLEVTDEDIRNSTGL